MTTLSANDLSVASLAKKTYLNFDQRQELERSIDATNTMLEETRAGRVDGDAEALEKQLRNERTMLGSGSPPELDTVSKNRLYHKVKELETKFTEALPTYEQMQVASPSHVDWHTAWERNHQQDVLAWKTGLMMLDPNNTEPNFRNVARLRGNTRQGTDPRKYWQGFEAIKFEAVEQQIIDDLMATLDDAAYMQFLQYKAAGWAQKSILKQLDWSKELYAAAQARFEKSMPQIAHPSQEDSEAEGNLTAFTAEPEEVETQEDPWPVPMIKAAGLSINKFCQRNGLEGTQFHKMKKSGKWSAAYKKAIEKGLKTLQEKKSGVTEPVTSQVTEPETTNGTEPTEE